MKPQSPKKGEKPCWLKPIQFGKSLESVFVSFEKGHISM